MKTKSRFLAGSWLSLRFSTIEPVSATVAPFSPPQSHTWCRCSRKFLYEQHQKKTLSHWHGAFAGRAEELARLQVFKILLFVRPRHQNRELSTLSCVSHHHFAEILAQQQCPKRPDDILPAHNDGHLDCWRRALTRVFRGSIFRHFTVRDRDKPVTRTIFKPDDLMADPAASSHLAGPECGGAERQFVA